MPGSSRARAVRPPTLPCPAIVYGVLTALRTIGHRFVVRQRLQEIAYSTTDRQMRGMLGSTLDRVCRRGVRDGWSARTTAAVLAAIWIGTLARSIEPDRRLRIARTLLEQEKEALTALEWIDELASGRLNPVGKDLFVLRYNVGIGTIAAWTAERKSVDGSVRRIFAAMAAWGLAGIGEEEMAMRFEEMLGELGA